MLGNISPCAFEEKLSRAIYQTGREGKGSLVKVCYFWMPEHAICLVATPKSAPVRTPARTTDSVVKKSDSIAADVGKEAVTPTVATVAA